MPDHEFSTPMMKQYMEIKKQYEDCFLFFRMGDFYELFLEDAKRGARILDITLTSRAKGKDGRVPMAGVPYHAVDLYLNKLVKAGHKVAICEQLTPPNAKGIVERDVVRVVTPGTLMDERALNRKENNYMVSVAMGGKTVALAAADLSTGSFAVVEHPVAQFQQQLLDEFARFAPSECIVNTELYNRPDVLSLLRTQPEMNIHHFPEWDSYAAHPEKTLLEHFQIHSLEVFGLQQRPTAQAAAAALMGYLTTTQKTTIQHIKTISLLNSEDGMLLDRSTIVNLELFSTIRDQEKSGSLVAILDLTTTAMGARTLREWVKKPLVQKERIEERLQAVDELLQKRQLRKQLQSHLEGVLDIERIIGRLSVGLGNPKDLVGMKESLREMLRIREKIGECTSPLPGEILQALSPTLEQLAVFIDRHILPDPAFDPRNGGVINDSIHPELDSLRAKVRGGKEWITELELQERKRTGIGSLKIRFNKVFGFYIEVSRANLNQVPDDYMRKQTLVNGERFITPELKEKEVMILTAEERMNTLEYELFLDVVTSILEHTGELQSAASAIAQLDCLVSFATIAEQNHYCRPQVHDGSELTIINGRHPVVEQMIEPGTFVPNSVTVNNQEQQLLMITGPNMAGKSVFIRQVAVITLMAHIGSFVPADQAKISLADRIFVRSGASDVITAGLSTFMVEMVETAHILNNATERSLIIMDEIGRGTSTYDGISIAWAISEYLVSNPAIAAKTLFATHYHELQKLEQLFPARIRNFHMAIEEQNGTPLFLHTLVPGGASHSFGIAVARLAGVPEGVTNRATALLTELEQEPVATANGTAPPPRSDVLDTLRRTDVLSLTPLQALNLLDELKRQIN